MLGCLSLLNLIEVLALFPLLKLLLKELKPAFYLYKFTIPRCMKKVLGWYLIATCIPRIGYRKGCLELLVLYRLRLQNPRLISHWKCSKTKSLLHLRRRYLSQWAKFITLPYSHVFHWSFKQVPWFFSHHI